MSGIRQAWTWYSPIRQEVINAAMVRVKGPSGRMRNEYTCYDCKQPTPKYDVHHDPEVGSAPDWPPTGNGEWEQYMLRVDCPSNQLFLLCQPCHLKRHHGDKENE